MKSDLELRGRKQIAHELGISTRSLSRWVKRGLVVATKPGGQTSALRVTRDELDRLKTGRK